MKTLLQIDFSFNGPFGEDMSKGLKDIAESINQESGFIWKIWTENEKEREAGGIYLFENESSALSYLEMHTARLKQFGVEEVNAKIFDVNVSLTEINKGSLA